MANKVSSNSKKSTPVTKSVGRPTKEKLIVPQPPQQEPVFELTSTLWEDILDDSKNLATQKKQMSVAYIQDKYGITKTQASNLKFALDNRRTIHDDISVSLNKRRIETKIKDAEEKNKSLLKKIEELQDVIDFVLGITNEPGSTKITQIKGAKGTTKEATAFAILSDVHIEERVTLEITDGINEYTPEIAKQRLHFFFVNLLKLIKKERNAVTINNLVLGLLGDFITGYIHEELVESNYMSPTEATRYVKNILIDGICYLVDNGDFDKILIPCCRGNHGRTTAKKRFNTGAENSFEWMMYKDMQQEFKRLAERDSKFDIIEFVAPKSELVHIQVYDKIIRFGHGDHFKFGGGIGGLNIPLKKWLVRQNEQRRADMTFIGHWHEILTPTSDCMVNGSVIGMNSYGMNFGGTPHEPQQIFTLLDSKEGFTIKCPIHLK